MSLPLYVAIAAAGRPALLARTLESLSRCIKPAGYAGTLVVENGPPSGISSVVQGFGRQHRFRYLYTKEANKSHAMNVALEHLDDAIVMFTDDDVRFDPAILTAYMQAAEGVEGGQCYGGPLGIDLEGEPFPPWLMRYLPPSAVGWELDAVTKTRLRKPWFIGPNWAAFTRDVWAVGGHDPRVGPGTKADSTGEETNLQRRLHLHGVEGYYLPDARVWHFVSRKCGSPEWILHRAYRHGLGWGVVRRTRLRPYVLAAFWSWLCSLPPGACALCLRAFGGPKAVFHARWLQAKWQGRLRGLRMARNWSEHPPRAPSDDTTSFSDAA